MKGFLGVKNVFLPADILLPKCDLQKWSVIACDQYTSEPDYWRKAGEIAGKSPSALNIILPEVCLKPDNTQKIKEINRNMKLFTESGLFTEYKNTYIFTRRTLKNGSVRRGIVGLIDLENYSFLPGERALTRATEKTVPERIPPRVEIRKDATLEMPHIMLLIDDKSKTVIEPLDKKTEEIPPVYDFDLMMESGHLTGKPITGKLAKSINAALETLAEKNGGMLFAVGDGNHSLAAAKECYERNKTEKTRYALAEIVNIHDDSLEFEPIYRVLFGADPEKVISDFTDFCKGEYSGSDAQCFTCVYGDKTKVIKVRPASVLCVGTLQSFVNEYLKKNTEIRVDYIHGEESVRLLAKNKNTVGFLFEGMKKEELFPAVLKDGSLPRKTFSMGAADDKRFYLECRSLV